MLLRCHNAQTDANRVDMIPDGTPVLKVVALTHLSLIAVRRGKQLHQ